jgi:UDP-glucose 4-epimerase
MEVEDLAATYNIGTGAGTSVLEVMLAVKRVTGIDFEWDVSSPRPGDPAKVVADPTKIHADLAWKSQHDLDSIVQSAWQAWRGV